MLSENFLNTTKIITQINNIIKKHLNDHLSEIKKNDTETNIQYILNMPLIVDKIKKYRDQITILTSENAKLNSLVCEMEEKLDRYEQKSKLQLKIHELKQQPQGIYEKWFILIKGIINKDFLYNTSDDIMSEDGEQDHPHESSDETESEINDISCDEEDMELAGIMST